MLESANKNIKTPIMTIIHMFKKLEEKLNMLSGDCKILKYIQIEILEVKTTISQVTFILDGIKNILEIAEEKIGEIEDIAIETIPN